MTDTQGFLEAVSDYVEPGGKPPRENRMGTVFTAPAAGLVRVTFDGEATPSPGGFAYNDTLTLVPGDRVRCSPSGSTYTVDYRLSTS